MYFKNYAIHFCGFLWKAFSWSFEIQGLLAISNKNDLEISINVNLKPDIKSLYISSAEDTIMKDNTNMLLKLGGKRGATEHTLKYNNCKGNVSSNCKGNVYDTFTRDTVDIPKYWAHN